jgi:hypothetical protein
MYFETDACEPTKHGDNICDLDQNWRQCDFDGGDCECHGSGNNWCEPQFNNDKCDWDGGDCCGPYSYYQYGNFGCLDPGIHVKKILINIDYCC